MQYIMQRMQALHNIKLKHAQNALLHKPFIIIMLFNLYIMLFFLDAIYLQKKHGMEIFLVN